MEIKLLDVKLSFLIKWKLLFSKYIQIIVYLFVNSLFVYKYSSRTNISPIAFIAAYLFLFTTIYILSKKYIVFFQERTLRKILWTCLLFVFIAIILSLIYIDRYTINVDRWSALTYFWDYFFQGKYPYSAHTHVSKTNFPSPFPFWQLINLPFYILGDVGIGLIFFLMLTAAVVQWYFCSYRKTFFIFIFLFLSPAYWWEIIVRSDSLNNAWFVFLLILWLDKSKRKLTTNLILIAILTGLILVTRLSALLPLAIYLFKPYLNLNLKQKIVFPALVFLVVFLAFSPFIFWDTHTWIFFSRNPFMSQADKGYLSILIISILIGIYIALKWKTIEQFFFYTSIFIFIFIGLSQLGLFIRSDFDSEFITGSICDISYFNLFLPYCLASLSVGMSKHNV